MALPRTQLTEGLIASLGELEQLLRTIDGPGWDTATRCDGWTVGDCARHAVGSIADGLSGRTDGLGTPEVTQREFDERAGRSPAELADECVELQGGAAALLPLFTDEDWDAPAPGGYEGTLGQGVEGLWADLWFHGDDMRAALGLEPVVDAGLPGAVSHITFELEKLGWAGEVPTDPHEQIGWLLAATGRAPRREGLPDVYA
jgi:uncharacterized protein (TIGR03083 family)